MLAVHDVFSCNPSSQRSVFSHRRNGDAEALNRHTPDFTLLTTQHPEPTELEDDQVWRERLLFIGFPFRFSIASACAPLHAAVGNED